jgi:hypothetical protein
MPRHQLVELVELVDRVTVGDLCQRVLEISVRFHAVELCRLPDDVYGCSAITAGIATRENSLIREMS